MQPMSALEFIIFMFAGVFFVLWKFPSDGSAWGYVREGLLSMAWIIIMVTLFFTQN